MSEKETVAGEDGRSGEEKSIELVEKVEDLRLEQESQEEEEEEEEDDDEGWITPDNLQRVCEEMGGVLDELPQSVAVGCITTDFAMQARPLPPISPL